MTLLFTVIFLGLILEDDYLLALAMLKNFCLSLDACKNGGTDLNGITIRHHEYIEINIGSDLAVELLDLDLGADLDLVLLTAGYYDCVLL